MIISRARYFPSCPSRLVKRFNLMRTICRSFLTVTRLSDWHCLRSEFDRRFCILQTMKALSSGGRFIVVGVPEKLDAATRRTVRSLQPGGFILFGRNIGLPRVPDAQGRPGVPG